MRYGIFSDVHSNLPALDSVLRAYSQERIDKYVCIGDVVGYASQPRECIAKIKDLNAILVAGNHDWACVDLISSRYFNPIALEAVEWTKDRLSDSEKGFLKSQELVFSENNFILAHGSLDSPEDFNYLFDQLDAGVTFELMSVDICFVGHTHIPGVFVKDNNRIDYIQEYPLHLSPLKKYIINVGSVGQPRDKNPQASYCVYDSDRGIIEIKRVDYDIKQAQEGILRVGLPSFLAERLVSGK